MALHHPTATVQTIIDAETRNQPGSRTRKRPKSKSNLNIIEHIDHGKKEVSVQFRQNHRGF